MLIWAARAHDGGSARQVTADTGSTSFTGDRYDLVVAGDRIHWTAEADDPRTTELRSVALTGGAVDVRQVPGLWTPSVWPWLTDRRNGRAGAPRLRNVNTGQDVRIETSDGDLAVCGPVWCRVWVPRRRGPARLDVMRPDGTDRVTINDSGADSATGEVAVADRFVVVTESEPNSSLIGTVTLLVYDIKAKHTVVVDSGASEVHGYGTMVWWSTGTPTTRRWTVIDFSVVR